MNLAIHNIHLAPNIFNLGIHNYVLDLVRDGHVRFLYFDDHNAKNIAGLVRRLMNGQASKIPWGNAEFIFSARTLRSKCDGLLSFNSYAGSDGFSSSVRSFSGLKIWHAGDYFWNEPGSRLNQRFESHGIDYLMGYASHDAHCPYFNKTFPLYRGKVIPVPFGFADRFVPTTPLVGRKNKCVALGSVNPLRPLDFTRHNYRETADFFPDECWFHKFRRMLVLNRERLLPVLDSMLPVFSQIKDFSYDLVAKFNEYRMFVSCESIFFFPPAKAFEGPACGSVMICADHDCNREFGFRDGENCIMYRPYDVDDFADHVRHYQGNEADLEAIQRTGTDFVRNHFSHQAIAKYLHARISEIHSNGGPRWSGRPCGEHPEMISAANNLSETTCLLP